MTHEREKLIIEETLRKCLDWAERSGYQSYDPFDALSSPFLYGLTHKAAIAQRVAVQLNMRSPVNLRPFLGIKLSRHPMALSHMVRAYALMFRANKNEAYEMHIKDLLDSLLRMAIWRDGRPAWGLNYPYAARFAKADADTINLFTTVNVASCFLDAAELLGNHDWIKIAQSAAGSVIDRLGYVNEDDTIWFSYYPGEKTPVFNVTAMMAAFLARLSDLTHETLYDPLISGACSFLAKWQNDDGSWFYARNHKGKWIDGFHTAYVLQSLKIIHHLRPESAIQDSLRRGLEFYVTNMFTPDGLPKYYVHSTYPIDSQNCAQSVETLAELSLEFPECLDLAYDAFLASRQLLFRDFGDIGYFILRRGRIIRNQLYSLRWAQAPMVLAMISLQLVTETTHCQVA